jgi:uncharacterized protein RhaS with RHS repeats
MKKKSSKPAGSVVTVLIGLAGFSGAAHARYIQADPTGLAAGPNLYSYAGQNPTQGIDPSGLDLLLITGEKRTDSWFNYLGHSAIAVTGSGTYSYGTGANGNGPNLTPLGMSTTQFLQQQSASRDLSLTVIKTTPEQDAAALKYLKAHPDEMGITKLDNCATRSEGAMKAAGIDVPNSMIDTPGKAEATAAALLNARTVDVPRNGQIPDEKSFNPYTLPAPPAGAN